jgi:transposase-like protein
MARKTTKRRRYSNARRAEILAVASKEGLTATDVHKRFGVVPVTYYSWRKKVGARRARAGRRVGGTSSAEGLRARVRGELERSLPRIVDQEVNRFLRSMFGAGPRRRT